MGSFWARTALLVLAIGLAGCASPTFQMGPEQVAALPDDELCRYKNNYRSETKLDAEVARRGLNCNRFHRECLRRGNQPETEAMAFCERLLRENERLRYDPPYDRFGVFGYGGSRRGTVGIGVGHGLYW
ncbi:MAG: hypothetical protein WC989_03360 [Micavibrio sp.]